jgi:hypothetical protein
MPDGGSVRLRIYCICGQKMRVSPSMLGRPGKCVACHQKIRIPRAEELPDGETELYLKDHPEFLRRREASPKSTDDTGDLLDEQEEEALGEVDEAVEAVPLDVLEPLQVLSSLEHSIQRQLDALRRKEPIAPVDKPTLLRYRALVRKARAGLDEQLRLRLHEVTDQLANNGEQLARATLAVRVGEMSYETFLRTVVPLRHRRERLERRRQNLRGWLAVSDAYMAGGYVDIRLEEVPCDPIEVTFPLEIDADEAVVDLVVENLRLALQNREQAEHKLTEWKRMEREGALQGAALEECLADSEAVRQRARAAVAFCRNRLEQVIQDCDNDINAIKAHLELARRRFEKHEVDEPGYQKMEMDLLRAQSDNAQVRDMARRALSANAASDVPHLKGTVLQRMAAPARAGGIGADSWVAWAASTMMVLNILIPLSSAQVGGNMVVARGIVIGFFIGSVVLAMLASIPRREIRGVLMTLFWGFEVIVGTWHLHRAWYSLGPVGGALRMDPRWYLGPGVLLAMFGGLVVGVAAWLSLRPVRRWRWLPPVVALINVAAILLIMTDGAGIFRARAYLDGPEVLSVVNGSQEYELTVTVGNGGRRTLWLGGQLDRVPSPVTFLLERQIGADSWKDLGAPASIKRSRAQWWAALRPGENPVTTIEPGDSVTLRYSVSPGTYRIQLNSPGPGHENIIKTFTLEPIGDAEEMPPPDLDATSDPMINDTFDPGAAAGSASESEAGGATSSASALIEVQLQGVIHGADRRPSFRVEIRKPDGGSERRNLMVGDTLYEPWKAHEYSPVQKTLTISNGHRLVILEPGQSYTLETTP